MHLLRHGDWRKWASNHQIVMHSTDIFALLQSRSKGGGPDLLRLFSDGEARGKSFMHDSDREAQHGVTAGFVSSAVLGDTTSPAHA